MDLTTIGFVETTTPQHIMLIRLAVAAILGGVIGFEREQHAAAGLRTHILIAVAACLYTLLTFEIFHLSDVVESGRSDPIRAIEAVTAGIAFLGAGAIFRSGLTVQGLTTGAGMWLAGAVGVAAALGYYGIGLAVAILAVVVLALMRRITQASVPVDDKRSDDR
ncbi:MgtC/SapB family protein [Devosia sp.]|jgi:putative Mg2+ transporter-C (MgtC) family protein|uniref:MgtC/SapB family protein n=1 Tax=Devosia sp. TaxID=1871048 RepID=UPI0037C17FDB